MDAAPLLFIGFAPSDTFDFRARRPSSEAGVHSLLAQCALGKKPGFIRLSRKAPFIRSWGLFASRTVRPEQKAEVLGRTAVRPYPRTSHCAPFETLSTHNKPL
jgi:hypothetical protein